VTRLSILPSALALGLVLTACGDDPGSNPGGFADASPLPDAPPPPPEPDAMQEEPDAGLPDAAPLPDAPTNPAGPDVTVISPTDAGGSTAADVIVTTSSVDVVCEALPDPTTMLPVNPNAVTVAAIGAEGETTTAQASPQAGQANRFVATVSVENFSNGPLTIRCTAADTAEPAAADSDENETFLDLGPNVIFVTPTDKEAFRAEVTALFQVLPDPVTDSGDTGATVDTDTVTVSIAGDPQDPDESGGFFSRTFLFDDFTPPLSGDVVIEVRASNTRQNSDASAAPVERVRRVTFVADDVGPTITITTPGPVELVSGVIDVTATITDAAGVGSVQGTLGRGAPFTLQPLGGDEFGATIDTRTFSNPEQVYPLLEVTATDGVGNTRTVGYEIALDNRPPLVTLDSPDMREFRVTPDFSLLSCSARFDPLGRDAVSFGQIVPQLFEIRARVEDRGNGPDNPGGVVLPIATVNLASVELYLLDDETLELLADLDNDDDNLCDEINPAVDPVLNPQGAEASLFNMAAVPISGSSAFVENFLRAPGSDGQIADAACFEEDETETPPANLCQSVDATRAIETPTGESAIFGLTPVDGDRCMGNAFDALANQVSDGWACLVVRAEDQLGNVGVSKILPVCIDTDSNTSDCAGTNNGDGTITPPGTVCPSSCVAQTDFTDIPGRQLRQVQVVGFTECSDGEDNDDDGDTDLDDPDCEGKPATTSETTD